MEGFAKDAAPWNEGRGIRHGSANGYRRSSLSLLSVGHRSVMAGIARYRVSVIVRYRAPPGTGHRQVPSLGYRQAPITSVLPQVAVPTEMSAGHFLLHLAAPGTLTSAACGLRHLRR